MPDLALLSVTALKAFYGDFQALYGVDVDVGRGRIVAVGARNAVEPSPNFAAYAVSKAALVALVKNVAEEGKKFGVTANVVLPSVIDTAVNRKVMPDTDFSSWVAPASIARLIVFLTSEAAADTNGAVIPIYGRA